MHLESQKATHIENDTYVCTYTNMLHAPRLLIDQQIIVPVQWFMYKLLWYSLHGTQKVGQNRHSICA